MTKKILAVVMALAVMMTACTMMAFAAETPTDIVPEIVLQLEANGAQGKMADIAADENAKVVVPENGFTNENYNFVGWNTTADGAGDAYQPGDEIVLKETLMIYAQWIHKDADFDEFTITYDANGGEGETVDDYGPYIEGGYAYTAYNNFTKAGAEFIGWNTKADGTGTMYGEDELFEIYEDVLLYAIWEGGEEEVPSEPETSEPEVEEPVVTDTDEEDDNPKTGSTSAAGAVVAGVVALGALVVLKKRD